MANKKISALDNNTTYSITETYLAIVDENDTTQAASGSNFKSLKNDFTGDVKLSGAIVTTSGIVIGQDDYTMGGGATVRIGKSQRTGSDGNSIMIGVGIGSLSGTSYGSYHIGIGPYCLRRLSSSISTARNIAIGESSAEQLISGSYNNFFGTKAGFKLRMDNGSGTIINASLQYANNSTIIGLVNIGLTPYTLNVENTQSDPLENILAIGTSEFNDDNATNVRYIYGSPEGISFGHDVLPANADGVTANNYVVANYASLNFGDDTAAAAGGVPLGGLYHDAGVARIRIS